MFSPRFVVSNVNVINVIKELYCQPTFGVEMEGRPSEWTKLETGIRQGCSSSPYLFIMPMTCLFHDVHDNDKNNATEQRIEGKEADEVLYTDDTICISEDEQAMSRLLQEIEKEGATYGMKLNKAKCEYLSFGDAGPVFFQDGPPVPAKTEVKCLGCNMNKKGDPGKEVSKIIKDCMKTG